MNKNLISCDQISFENIGSDIYVRGFVSKKRKLGSLIFVNLRDLSGEIQIVFKEENLELYKVSKTLNNQDVIAVGGVLSNRKSINEKQANGAFELIPATVDVFSRAQTPPLIIENKTDALEKTRLKYRYLDLRRPNMQKNLKLRHQTILLIRNYLDNLNFLEIETPILNRSTPEGARDFLVPSRSYENKNFALPQSPQLFKQLLMISGMERYFQIAKCFRDEDMRKDRQPEFTQLDIEIAFADQATIIDLTEKLLTKIFKEILNVDLGKTFPTMTYDEAISNYGSDKPDLRYDLKLNDFTDMFKNTDIDFIKNALLEKQLIKAVVIEKSLSKNQLKKLENEAKKNHAKGLMWIEISNSKIVASSILKLLSDAQKQLIISQVNIKSGFILMTINHFYEASVAMGAIRVKLAQWFELANPNEYKCLWVLDFPMFEKDADNKITSMHHPFTAPNPEDINLLDEHPLKVRSTGYDIIINGFEIGGGSLRITDNEIQRKIFKLLDLSDLEVENNFGFFLKAFSFGAPPHGGIAWGLDRLLMIMTQSDSIRDVIPFPKNSHGRDLMMDAPS